MKTNLILKFCGWCSIVCGVLTAVYWLFHPAAGDPKAIQDDAYWQAVQSQRYIVINALFLFIIVTNIFGLSGIYFYLHRNGDKTAFVAYLLAVTGLILFAGVGVFNAFVVPEIVKAEQSSLLLPDGVFMTGSLGELFKETGSAFAAGYIILSLKTFRSGVFPAWMLLMLLSALILGLSPLMPLFVRIAGCGIYGTAHILLGIQVLKKITTNE